MGWNPSGDGGGGGGSLPSGALGRVLYATGASSQAWARPFAVIDAAEEFGVDFSQGISGPDQAPAIQSALAAAAAQVNASGRLGCVVQLPLGTANIRSGLTVDQGVWLRGHGAGLTEMYATNWGASTSPLITVANTAWAARISDLSMGCDNTPTSAPNGIEVLANTTPIYSLGGDFIIIHDVLLTDICGDGIVLDSGAIECRLLNCYVRTSQASGRVGRGFVLNGTDNMIVACTADTCAEEGFAAHGSNLKFAACKAFGCNGSGFNISGQRSMFTSCEAQDNKLYGFNDSGGDNVFAGCVADTNGRGGGTNYGFNLGSNSCAVGCLAINRTGTTQTYAYRGFGSPGPTVVGTSILAGSGHVAPGSVGSFNINNLQGSQVVAYAAAITPDPYLGGLIIVGSLTGAITINNVASGLWAGLKVGFQLPQDATGGRTVTFGSQYLTTAAIPTTASTTTVIWFQYDGTNFREVSRSTI